MSSDIVRRTSIFRTAKLPFFKISHTDFALVERQIKKKNYQCLRKEGYFHIHIKIMTDNRPDDIDDRAFYLSHTSLVLSRWFIFFVRHNCHTLRVLSAAFA